ncbi:hypothetical protein OAP39_02030 [Flavobacteriaceae bacterium]|nr:hypothetical protein [Flavobacteriaceae bacterium]
MQYTANKPHNAVLIIQDSGIRYCLKEDHIFKDIRFAQITVIKLKADSNLFPRFFLDIIGIVSNSAIIYFVGYSTIVLLNLVFWIFLGVTNLWQKRNYTVEVHKGPLVAEVFISNNKNEALQIKKEIESHL